MKTYTEYADQWFAEAKGEQETPDGHYIRSLCASPCFGSAFKLNGEEDSRLKRQESWDETRQRLSQ